MPVFTEKIRVAGNLTDLKLNGGFKFRTKPLAVDLTGFRWTKNENSEFEFVSSDTVYKVPTEELGAGDEIVIFTDDNKTGSRKAKIVERSFLGQDGTDFKPSPYGGVNDDARFVWLDCDLRFTAQQMTWILVGSRPVDMEDRIVMYSRDDTIFIHASWTGALYFVAKYQRTGNDEYLVYQLKAAKRNVPFSHGELIGDFKAKIERHLKHGEQLNRWAREFFEKNKNRV